MVHELSHLIARSHNSRTIAVMDRHRPDWTARRDELNGAPPSRRLERLQWRLIPTPLR
ncbi:YgjP-like metallopeptidase domain-containing protein [Corynebacterium callunae]|uniref:YgjP-like metallopeptidase domain-containing protein n=1 Tax=Corynebacterium callunae TaxID=1721 RepID=UPI001FE10090|nr:YgjP-like metallopeptidase domain-containing protein [Corynebacterium callunae]